MQQLLVGAFVWKSSQLQLLLAPLKGLREEPTEKKSPIKMGQGKEKAE